jgi:hypothetical protein
MDACLQIAHAIAENSQREQTVPLALGGCRSVFNDYPRVVEEQNANLGIPGSEATHEKVWKNLLFSSVSPGSHLRIEIVFGGVATSLV